MIFIYFLYFNRCKFEDKDDETTTEETTLTNHSSQMPVNRFARAEGKNDKNQEQLCEISIPISVAAYLLMTIVGAFGLLEIYMQLRVDTRYIKNWRTWV